MIVAVHTQEPESKKVGNGDIFDSSKRISHYIAFENLTRRLKGGRLELQYRKFKVLKADFGVTATVAALE